jgi:hypothetical protein
MITNREQFTLYCLRSLGGGELGNRFNEIEINEEQLTDRIDDTIQFYNEYGYNGTQHVYLKYQITASTMTIGNSIGQNFQLREQIKGVTSGATAFIATDGRNSEGITLIVSDVVGSFMVGEPIIGISSGVNSTFVSLVKGSYDNQCIDVPSNIYNVVNIIHKQSYPTNNVFSNEYRFFYDAFRGLSCGNIIDYVVGTTYIETANKVLNGGRCIPYDFNKHTSKIYLNVDWKTTFFLGQYILFECYSALDPVQWSNMWNDRWLKKYGTAQIKKQWGMNIKKYNGVLMVGDVVLNGQAIYDEAISEISYLEEELISKNSSFVGFIA